jgi:hypothetical protein
MVSGAQPFGPFARYRRKTIKPNLWSCAMMKLGLALVAAGMLAASALPAASAEQKANPGVTNAAADTVQLSARRYYRGYRNYGYRGGYRSYYRPYAYGPGPYYYGPRYYRPAPFPFFPFF